MAMLIKKARNLFDAAENNEINATNARLNLTRPESLFRIMLAAEKNDLSQRGEDLMPGITSPIFNDVMIKQRGENYDPTGNNWKNQRTLKIQDNRNIDPTKKVDHFVDPQTVRDVVETAKKAGINPNILVAQAIQETGFKDRLNPLHNNNINTPEFYSKLQSNGYWNYKKAIENNTVSLLKDKTALAKRRNKTSEEDKVQAYNGYGMVGDNQFKMYGRKERINTNKDPVYGKAVMDIARNVVAKDPGLQSIINEGQYLTDVPNVATRLIRKHGGKIN
jgi:hypothetical protein